MSIGMINCIICMMLVFGLLPFIYDRFEKKNLVSSRNSENQAADSSVDVDSPVDIVSVDLLPTS